jgi:hypothetical protein
MAETLRKEWLAKFAIILFLILTIWWFLSPTFQNPHASRFFGDFPSIYGIMALFGAIFGLYISQKWGWTKSIMGKAILLFALGLFAQELGQIIYAYYAFYKHIAVPYPSWGDLGYFGSIPLYIYGVILLGHASGVKIKLRTVKSKFQAVIIPLGMLLVGYFLFMQGYKFDWSNPIKIFLDFGYPFGQAIYLSLAILTYLLSNGILGGLMKNKIRFILFALIVQFFSDYTFLYQSSRGTWSAGGINDYMYLCAYLVMTLGLLQFNTVLSKLKK